MLQISEMTAAQRLEYWTAEYKKLRPPVPGGEIWLHPDFEHIYKNWEKSKKDLEAEAK